MLTSIEWWLFYETSSCMHRATCLSETTGGTQVGRVFLGLE